MNNEAAAPTLRHSILITLLFQFAWIITGLIFVLTSASIGWGLLLANMLILWAPTLFMLSTHMQLSYRFQIGFAVFLSASSLIGSALGGYGTIPHWDTIVHFYSGVLLAWFGFILVAHVEKSIKKVLPRWFRNVVALMASMAFAATWEIYEFMSDALWGTSMQAGGLEDTVIDMFAGLIGAIAALLIGALWSVKRFE